MPRTRRRFAGLVAAGLIVAAVPSIAQEVAPSPCARALTESAAQRDADALESADRCERESASLSPATGADLAYVRGTAVYRRGLNVQSIDWYERSLALATTAGDRAKQRRAYEGLATASINLGHHERFFQYAQRSFELADKPTERDRIIYALRRAIVYEELADVDRADALYQEAYDRCLKDGDMVLLSQILNGWALLYARTGIDRARALRYFDEGLKRLAPFSNRDAVAARAPLLNNSANQFRDDPETVAEALKRYRESLRIAQQLKRYDLAAFTLKNIGRALRIQGRPSDAEPMLVQAVATADGAGVTRARWQARMELGTLLADRDSPTAERWYREAIDILEGQHSNALLGDYQAGALAGDLTIYDNPYELLVRLLRRAGRDADAFMIAERSRARTFLDTLTAARETLATAVPDTYIRAEAEVLRKLSAASGADRERIEDELAALRVTLAAEHPRLAHSRFPAVATIAALQSGLLAADEAIVEFFVGADESTAWVVLRDRATAITVPGRRQLQAPVQAFVAAVSSPAGDTESSGRALAQILWAPIDAHLDGVQRLTIVPDALLHYLPFEALPDARGNAMIVSRAVGYAPSSSTLAFLRAQPLTTGTEAIAIGNPAIVPGAGEGSLKPLPFAADEMKAIAGQAGPTRILEGAEATETAVVTRDYSRVGIVHFATHGVIDERRPARSGLWLATSPQADGLLQVREIYQLKLHGALVTLSACETALGRVVTGEGIIGLARAFFFAGANTVVASLWNVNDAATAEFMERFYGALADGEPVDSAVRSAKLDLIRSGTRLSHPYYWAPFVAIGRVSEPVLAPQSSWKGVTLAGLGLAVVIGAALLIGLRRSRVR